MIQNLSSTLEDGWRAQSAGSGLGTTDFGAIATYCSKPGKPQDKLWMVARVVSAVEINYTVTVTLSRSDSQRRDSKLFNVYVPQKRNASEETVSTF